MVLVGFFVVYCFRSGTDYNQEMQKNNEISPDMLDNFFSLTYNYKLEKSVKQVKNLCGVYF